MSISLIKHEQINKDVWDEVVNASTYGHIYALSWYLDAIVDRPWDAIVYKDYAYIMPICVNRKWGILPYFFRPFLCQQLGIFGKMPLEKGIQEQMLSFLSNKIKFIDITLHGNHGLDQRFSHLPNHIIPDLSNILNIRNNYNRNTKRNIKAARQVNFNILHTNAYENVVTFLIENQPFDLTKAERIKVESLLYNAYNQSVLDVFWLKTIDNIPQCVTVCMRFHRRIYFLLIASSAVAKKNNLTFALIDYMLEQYAGSTYEIFDFTGSKMPTISQRNEGFGAQVETYYRYQKKWL